MLHLRSGKGHSLQIHFSLYKRTHKRPHNPSLEGEYRRTTRNILELLCMEKNNVTSIPLSRSHGWQGNDLVEQNPHELPPCVIFASCCFLFTALSVMNWVPNSI